MAVHDSDPSSVLGIITTLFNLNLKFAFFHKKTRELNKEGHVSLLRAHLRKKEN